MRAADGVSEHRPIRRCAGGTMLAEIETALDEMLNEIVVSTPTQSPIPQRRSEDTLDASEALARKLALVAQWTDNAVIVTDAKGRIEWVNRGFTRMTEYELDEVRGRNP